MSTRNTYRTGWISAFLIITEVVFWALIVGAYFFAKRIAPNISVQNPEGVYLIAITVVAVVIFLGFLAWRNRMVKRFADLELVKYAIPYRSLSSTVVRFVVWRLALACIVIGFIDPKIGTKPEMVEAKGVDLMVAIDVSNSMMAEDLSPSRLDVAKQTIQRMISNLDGDRIGIVIFAGDAFVQLPITTDIQSAKTFLNAVQTNSIAAQGTAIGTAIDLCVESFDPESQAGKAILIFTDGENHEDDASSAAKNALEKGIKVFAIGMGSPEGAPIPEYNSAGRRTGFKTDNNGTTVVTALDENMLVDIVKAGDGIFVRSGKNFANLSPIFDEIDLMNESESGQVQFSDYEHRFQAFVFIGFLLLLLEAVLSERKWTKSFNL